MEYSYHQIVPKNLKANLRFRKAILQWAREDRENARALWIMCSRDILFWLNVFGWVYEPRGNYHAAPKAKRLPFITWEYQDRIIKTLVKIDGEDVILDKCREMGVSWIGCALFAWLFQFRDMESLLMVSSKEAAVDSKGDSDSLFWKIEFLLDNEPSWLQPNYSHTLLHFINHDNKSIVDGSSTNEDIGRGGRRTRVWIDEAAKLDSVQAGMGDAVNAATANVSDNRIFCSTHKGTGTAFYKHGQDIRTGKAPGHIIDVDWWENPKFAEDLEIVNGKRTSTWYRWMCGRLRLKPLIAQELDRNPMGSSCQFFDSEFVAPLEKAHAQDPVWVGVLKFDEDAMPERKLTERKDGWLRLFVKLQDDRPKATDSFIVAADISHGLGSSNSVATILNASTGEEVGVACSSSIEPRDFASLCVALARKFNHAMLNWEENGPTGLSFLRRIQELNYKPVYMRERTDRVSRERTEKPGWRNSGSSKQSLMHMLRDALRDGSMTMRDKGFYKELSEYQLLPNGKVAHHLEVTADNPLDLDSNHGDRVISAGVALIALQKWQRSNANHKEEKIVATTTSSFFLRREHRMQELVEQD